MTGSDSGAPDGLAVRPSRAVLLLYGRRECVTPLNEILHVKLAEGTSL